MASYRDHAPVPNTCPKINEVISGINDADWTNVEWYTKESVLEIMEEIRSANSSLRDWGNEQCQLAIDYENDIEQLNKTINDKDSRISELEDTICSIENDIAEYEDSLRYLKYELNSVYE